MVIKIFNFLFCIIFIIFAALQYNDPDPYIWIPIYLYASVLCGLVVKNKFYLSAYLLGIAVYGSYAAYLFFANDGVLNWIQQHHSENIAKTMKAEKPWIEETREFFGLVILIVVLLVDYFYGRRKLSASTAKN